MSEVERPHPLGRAPLHPVIKPGIKSTKAGSLSSSRFSVINSPILPPRTRPILLRGAVPIPLLSNGVGRYTCMLLRMTIVRCDHRYGTGLNQWINTKLKDFSGNNPHVAIYVRDNELPMPRARVYGNYAHGNNRQFDLHKMNPDQIERIMYRMVDMSGPKELRLREFKHSVRPSIQGYWHPFLNKPWRKLTQTDTPNLKTEQELMQRRLIHAPTSTTETEV